MIDVKEDLTGKKFGRWTVICRTEDKICKSGERIAMWLCECSCGNKKIVSGRSLNRKQGGSKSCGCATKEAISEANKKYNTYNLSGEYGIGYTSKGEEFYFDLDDYDKIKDYCWNKNEKGYIICNQYNASNKKQIKVRMHRIIVDCPDDLEVDHINHNVIDNRKNNLRICNHNKNSMNRNMRSDNTSGITGVRWSDRYNKWEASIGFKGKRLVKRFVQLTDAINQRKKWEEELFGNYSYNNSIKKEVI